MAIRPPDGIWGCPEQEQHKMERVRHTLGSWRFPDTWVGQMLNPSLCSKQMEPHSVIKIDCSDEVLIERLLGQSRFRAEGPATEGRESAGRNKYRAESIVASTVTLATFPPSPVEQQAEKLILKKKKKKVFVITI